ncbi:hypothetical protein LSH36_1549g00017 [Paralvinella palmiformis]|uniref:CAP-Gly domain-containing protein n=1 Tax=Paralvinella palmiformis TaxID=53620 RepID=A0AAD9ISV0_9ANNE|nr:hypothetical protein LSH36_1549g00017 [Paralvinella palmiformis]
MVLFDNIKIGQRVEVRWRGSIEPGTIKYKGAINGVGGEWVGVSLDRKVGLHGGMLKGRRYFLCEPKHGIFTLASQIRFIPLRRCLYNNYRTLESVSVLEDDLFGDTERPAEDTSGWVVKGFAEKIQSLRYKDVPLTDRPKTSTLRHSIGRTMPPATWLRPETARADYAYRSQPIHREYENDADDFIHSASIPLIHMPHTALKKQVLRGWARAPLVRYWTVHTGKDSIKHSQWNDISA